MKQNNNFKNPETRKAVRYRLYIIHNDKGVSAGYPRKFGYNGYVTHADKGLDQLMSLLSKRIKFVVLAKLYDFNKSRTTPIWEWNFKKAKQNIQKNKKEWKKHFLGY